jgi:hypothetical protein
MTNGHRKLFHAGTKVKMLLPDGGDRRARQRHPDLPVDPPGLAPSTSALFSSSAPVASNARLKMSTAIGEAISGSMLPQ